jgi:hypothetical protein
MRQLGVRASAAVIALAVLLCVIAVASREPVRGSAPEPAAEAPRAEAPVTRTRRSLDEAAPPVVTYDAGRRSATPAWQWWALAALGLAGVGAAGVLLVPELRRRAADRRARRGGAPALPAPTVAEADEADEADDEVVERALEAAASSLREPSEPRAAVIEAYARMEQVLADSELSRAAAEAPREYLARVLSERGMPRQSLATITALFEEARFSAHPVHPSAPGRALSELDEVRAALSRVGCPRQESNLEPSD